MDFTYRGTENFGELCSAINRLFYSVRADGAPRSAEDYTTPDIVTQIRDIYGNAAAPVTAEDLLGGTVYVRTADFEAAVPPEARARYNGFLNPAGHRYEFTARQFLETLSDVTRTRIQSEMYAQVKQQEDLGKERKELEQEQETGNSGNLFAFWGKAKRQDRANVVDDRLSGIDREIARSEERFSQRKEALSLMNGLVQEASTQLPAVPSLTGLLAAADGVTKAGAEHPLPDAEKESMRDILPYMYASQRGSTRYMDIKCDTLASLGKNPQLLLDAIQNTGVTAEIKHSGIVNEQVLRCDRAQLIHMLSENGAIAGTESQIGMLLRRQKPPQVITGIQAVSLEQLNELAVTEVKGLLEDGFSSKGRVIVTSQGSAPTPISAPQITLSRNDVALTADAPPGRAVVTQISLGVADRGVSPMPSVSGAQQIKLEVAPGTAAGDALEEAGKTLRTVITAGGAPMSIRNEMLRVDAGHDVQAATIKNNGEPMPGNSILLRLNPVTSPLVDKFTHSL